jgi:glycosyltransferase involved in cell wall biosynthesis
MLQVDISIIVITRNRSQLLSKCLLPLVEQLKDRSAIEVLIIDNNSTDATSDFLIDFTTKNSKFHYFIESQVGASFARNKGIDKAKGSWLCFLDDDGIPDADFIDKLVFTIKNYHFDGFGGMWYPYADKKVPSWIPKEVTTMRFLTKIISEIPYGETVAAGICAFKKEIVIKAGCFSTDVGPRDGKMGYGEEDFLQQKIWQLGGIIGFNPEWSMRHYVSAIKFSLIWNLNRYYLKGRDGNVYLPKLSFYKKIILSFRVILVPPYLLILNTPQMLFNKNYFWQNWVLDSFKYSLRIYGRISSKRNY